MAVFKSHCATVNPSSAAFAAVKEALNLSTTPDIPAAILKATNPVVIPTSAVETALQLSTNHDKPSITFGIIFSAAFFSPDSNASPTPAMASFKVGRSAATRLSSMAFITDSIPRATAARILSKTAPQLMPASLAAPAMLKTPLVPSSIALETVSIKSDALILPLDRASWTSAEDCPVAWAYMPTASIPASNNRSS